MTPAGSGRRGRGQPCLGPGSGGEGCWYAVKRGGGYGGRRLRGQVQGWCGTWRVQDEVLMHGQEFNVSWLGAPRYGG